MRRKARPSCAKPAQADFPSQASRAGYGLDALCEEARLAPCTAGGTRARPRVTRRWHRATAERLGGHHGKSGSHHHEGAKDRALPALERRS